MPIWSLPDDLAEALGPDTPVHLWRVQAHVAGRRGSAPPGIVRDGTSVERWDPSAGPFPGISAWYDERSEAVFALSEKAPEGLGLESAVDPSSSFGACERLLGGTPTQRGPDGGELPELETLIQRFQLHTASRRCLLLPAGGSLTVPFDSLPADSLSVTVGIVDAGFRVDQDRFPPLLVPESGLSDGADFVVEVIDGTGVHEVWRWHHERRFIRWGFYSAKIDLSPWRGRPIGLRLRTEPGPEGDASFDYGVWSDLRLLASSPSEPTRPHVVLIDIDTLRADRMSCYGNERRTTPRIDAWFAREGTRYERATAPSSWTLPSTASLLTGLAPHQHRVLEQSEALPAGVTTLAGLLRDAGYLTYADVEGAFLGPGFGMDAGFVEHRMDSGSDEVQVAKRWSRYLDRIRSNPAGRPLFLFLQTYLVHAPYLPDPRFEDPEHPYQGWLQGQDITYPRVIDPFQRGELELSQEDRDYISGLYDAGIARMDEVVGAFLEALEETLGDEQALVILTSDHGEEFFEHGGMGHGHSVYEELIEIPMLVRFPRDLGIPTGVSRSPVSLLDVMPTVLAVAGVEPPSNIPGSSLLTDLPDRRVQISQTSWRFSVDLDGEKLVLGVRPGPDADRLPIEFYRLDEDPTEQHNLLGENADEAQRLERSLKGYLKAYRAIAPAAAKSVIRDDEADALRALGYLGDG